jgi:hypothetical protein
VRSLRSESSAARLRRSGSKSSSQIFVVSQMSALDAGGRYPGTDLGLVLVGPRGVDVPVADLERVADALGRVLAGDQPRAEAEPRDLGALDRQDRLFSSQVRHGDEATRIAVADTLRRRCYACDLPGD